MLGKDSGNLQIKLLLSFREEVDANILGSEEDLQGLLVNVMVLLLLDLLDVVVIPWDGDLNILRMRGNCKYLFANRFGFGLFGEEGKDLLNDTGENVSILILWALFGLSGGDGCSPSAIIVGALFVLYFIF